MQESYSRRQVERSFRKFDDTVKDLFAAKFQTWGDAFSHLLTHCEQDSVMKVVTDPLRQNRTVNAEKWYQEVMSSVRGMVGSGRYALPYDDDDRTALLYQFFLLLENDKVDFVKFCMVVYGTTKYQESVYHFNQELVLKFTREVSYRLGEILSDLGDKQVVPREAMVVFHHHDNTVNIHGNIQASNLAVGSSTISDAVASYASNSDVADALKALKPFLQEVVASQREAVENALATLVRAATDQAVTSEDVKNAATVVAESSPTLKDRLAKIATKLGLSLAGSAIFQGIKMAFGLH